MGKSLALGTDRSRLWWILGSAGVVVIMVPLMMLVVRDSYVIAAGVGAALVVGLWLMRPAEKDRTPKVLALLITAFVFSSVLPGTASLALQGLAVVLAVFAWLATPAAERRGKMAVSFALVILVLWAIFMFNPNVPDLYTGLLGFRKTAFCVAGVIAGCAVPKNRIAAFEMTFVRVLILALGVSIVAHLFIPSIEALVSRSADEYTALIGGKVRLQGVFAGPFHVALGGLMLMGWGLVRFKTSRLTAVVALGVGSVALYLTLVRTAYVGVAIIVIGLVIVSPNLGKFLSRFSVAICFATLIVIVVLNEVPQLATTALSIFDFESDGRFLNRIPEWTQGLAMFNSSPVFGWGSGSAGDTLGPAFANGLHVTPHNMVLKVVVEGGLIGALAWAGMVVGILRKTRWNRPGGRLSVVAFASLIGIGLTGSGIDTLPISFIVFFFAGLALDAEAKIGGIPNDQAATATTLGRNRERDRPSVLVG